MKCPVKDCRQQLIYIGRAACVDGCGGYWRAYKCAGCSGLYGKFIKHKRRSK